MHFLYVLAFYIFTLRVVSVHFRLLSVWLFGPVLFGTVVW